MISLNSKLESHKVKKKGLGFRVQPFHLHLAESVYEVVLQKSIPAQIRHLILSISKNKGQVDDFLRELTAPPRSALFSHIIYSLIGCRKSTPPPNRQLNILVSDGK